MVGELQTKLQAEVVQNKSLLKEVGELKRQQTQADGRQNAVEVRVRRAQEEAEQLRQELRSAKDSQASTVGGDRSRIQALEDSNKQLKQQKRELMTAFKKQLKLIDILKRQKLHVEAARVLQFTEEEFVKAMDWGTAVA